MPFMVLAGGSQAAAVKTSVWKSDCTHTHTHARARARALSLTLTHNDRREIGEGQNARENVRRGAEETERWGEQARECRAATARRAQTLARTHVRTQHARTHARTHARSRPPEILCSSPRL